MVKKRRTELELAQAIQNISKYLEEESAGNKNRHVLGSLKGILEDLKNQLVLEVLGVSQTGAKKEPKNSPTELRDA